MNEQHYLTPLRAPLRRRHRRHRTRETLGSVVVRNMLEAGFRASCSPSTPNTTSAPASPATAASRTSPPPRPRHHHHQGRPRPGHRRCLHGASAGTKAVVIITAGFSDAGPRPHAREEHLTRTPAATASACSAPTASACCARARPQRQLRPRCASKGSIGLISQSGALCAAILDWAKPQQRRLLDRGLPGHLGPTSTSAKSSRYMVSDSRTERASSCTSRASGRPPLRQRAACRRARQNRCC